MKTLGLFFVVACFVVQADEYDIDSQLRSVLQSAGFTGTV
jgi:hypothetical protein